MLSAKMHVGSYHPVRDPLKSPEQRQRQIRLIWRWKSSTGILLHVRAPRAICMPPIYRYWYVYSRSIFRIQNSEYAFHFICVFSVDFQKHATSYSDACFWKSTENTHIKVECLFWILNSENWPKIHIYWLARIAWICKFTSFQISRGQFLNGWISDRVGYSVQSYCMEKGSRWQIGENDSRILLTWGMDDS